MLLRWRQVVALHSLRFILLLDEYVKKAGIRQYLTFNRANSPHHTLRGVVQLRLQQLPRDQVPITQNFKVLLRSFVLCGTLSSGRSTSSWDREMLVRGTRATGTYR